MKNVFVFALFLVFGSALAQTKKDTTDLLNFKFRWYLNNVRDSTKVEEDIKKAIEKEKARPKIKFHNRLCYNYKTKKPHRSDVVFLFPIILWTRITNSRYWALLLFIKIKIPIKMQVAKKGIDVSI